ncbi:5-deoxyglucuronate isomerase [Micromonospora rhizosphaerae]|uniref:5-deoxyglucuronate isomerase n=1 Tax=Micromonospora rhizosphaerae TaxID=568872 RepID=A0A1C6SYW3_9ACTN|nr:5-deoxy-glucuronate isomerase [Micromonospora rhizosphaerae]SCL34766.1 5-deoxyglucuronate isomerase [Micromonospora rhizosphaerae]
MTGDNARWVWPDGSATEGGFRVSITDATPGWRHTSLRVAELAPGEQVAVDLGETEVVVVPLRGGCVVSAVDGGGERHEAELAGRADVFAGPTDVAYVPRGSQLTARNDGSGPARVALCGATATKRATTPPFRHLAAADVPVELRGAGTASRLVRNFGVPDVLDADSIIACEVITPAGNWSSYPPHKHDEERPGAETELEEIYYFELRTDADGSGDPIAYQRVYGTAERPLDVLAEVRTGDVVLVPHGWHGPAMAPPGYDLYYLNVMAGPGATRAWLICDDPAHGWVRGTWDGQSVDPRLASGGYR